MELIEGVALSKLCDYSFGDQSGQWGNIYTSFMKDANFLNTEFATKVFEVMQTRDYMTVFIDNIRLYKRKIASVKPEDERYVNALMARSDLLELCGNFPQMNFIIFTNLEDTPIDDFILDKIPENVVCISAINAITYGGKIIPAPYGVQRRMTKVFSKNSNDFYDDYAHHPTEISSVLDGVRNVNMKRKIINWLLSTGKKGLIKMIHYLNFI